MINKKLSTERQTELREMLLDYLKQSNNYLYYSVHYRRGDEKPKQYISIYSVTSDKSIKNLNYMVSEYLGIKRDTDKTGYIITMDTEMMIKNHLSSALYGNDYQITSMIID